MLKSVLYYFLLLTTSIRLADIIYLLCKDSTNLPIPVIIAASAVVIYGLLMGVRKFFTTIRLKQILMFYCVQTGVIVFNLIYIAVACPLQISALETVVVGTFLDLLINAGAIHLMLRQMRSFSFSNVDVPSGVVGER